MASGERSDVCDTDKVGGRLQRGRLERGRLQRGRLARLDAELQAWTSLQEREAPTDKCSWCGGAA